MPVGEARPSKDSFPFYLKSGPTSSLSGGQINFNGTIPYGNGGKGQYLERTARCGSFPDSVNAFGLYDMHGNVWEWCEDWYGKYPTERVTDPAGPPEGSDRVFRGGGWNYGGQHCRAANRVLGSAGPPAPGPRLPACPSSRPVASASKSEHLRSPQRRPAGEVGAEAEPERRRSLPSRSAGRSRCSRAWPRCAPRFRAEGHDRKLNSCLMLQLSSTFAVFGVRQWLCLCRFCFSFFFC